MSVIGRLKQSEPGPFPNDWSTTTLDSLVTIRSGESPSRFKMQQSGLPYFKVDQLNLSSKYQIETPYYISELAVNPVPQRSLIFPKRGASILLNKVRILGQPSFMDTNLMTITPDPSISIEFLYYVIAYIKLSRIADTASIPQINNKHILPLVIPLPRRAEQDAIAEALSDADAYVDSISQLLTKKRAIRQGVIHNLLTGERRLSGFAADWVVRRLSDLADIRSGGTPSTGQSLYWNGDVPWCTPTDITALRGRKYLSSTARSISRLGLQTSSAELLPQHSVVMTSRATIGECAITCVPVTTNQGFKNFITVADVDAEFLYYLLLTQKDKFIRLSGGSTFLEIGKSQLSVFEVRMPSAIDEQRAISRILSDIDTEIFELETRLEKAHDIKAGMAQQLLTGTVRLI